MNFDNDEEALEFINRLLERYSVGIYNYFQGATINNLVINGNMNKSGTDHISNNGRQEEAQDKKADREMPSWDIITKAIENVSGLFWGNSSYAVLYCVFRDYYSYKGSRSQYEREIGLLHFQVTPLYICTPGVVSSTFSDNRYMELHIDKWADNHAPERTMKLVEGFIKALDEQVKGKKFPK